MQKKYTYVFLLLIVFESVLAQSNPLITIEKHLDSSREFAKKDLDSALFYADKALLLSQNHKSDTLIAQAYIQKSNILILKGGFPIADSLLHINLEKNLPLHIIGQTWHNIASIQFYKKNYKGALDKYLKAASFLEDSKNTAKAEMLANTYSNIGILNAALKNFEKAKEYLEKALSYNPKEDALRLKINSNLCTVYYDLKLLHKFIKKATDTEKLALGQDSKRVLSVLYTNLTNYYTDIDPQYNSALDYGKKSVVLKKELNFTQSLAFSYNNLGHAYLKNKNYKSAIKYLDSTIQSTTGSVSPVVYNNLKEAYTGLGNYPKALFYADLRDHLKDSISDEKQKSKVAELMEQFESEKKQQQIDILDAKNDLQTLTIKNQKYIFWGLLAIVFCASIIGFFSFKNFKTKQKLDKVLLRQKILKAQLNPHFLFNALQSIQNFIYQNNTKKSTSYLANYSKLIRLVLENSDKDLIPIAEDKLAIHSYLNLQQLAQKDSFEYTINVDSSINSDFDCIPPLISQSFVENAVIHGIKNIENGKINVNYYKENNALCVSIKDNGKGIVAKKEEEKRLHKSMSLNIIKEQFETLSQTSKNFKGEIFMDFSEGTQVILKIVS